MVAIDLGETRRLVNRGRTRDALRRIERLQARPDVAELPDDELVPLHALALECHLAHGDLGPARGVGDELADQVTGPHAALALHARGELASAMDQPEAAVRLFLAAGEAGGDDVRPLLPWRCGAALASVSNGAVRDAVDLAHSHHGLALTHGTAHDVALALRTVAIVETDGQRLERLREARDLVATGDSDRLRAQIDTDLAWLLLLAGEPVTALELLRSVESFAAHQDLWPLQSRVRRLLAHLGEEPRRLEAEALALLTSGERRVALLALEGQANRDIAAQLGVSVKAVEGHLSKTYRKLGICSRAGLAEIFGH